MAWQFVHHLSDLASIGSTSNRPPSLTRVIAQHSHNISSYSRILAIYDSDPADDLA